MPSCPVCGRDSETDHKRCVNAAMSVTLQASEWLEISETIWHYSKLLDAFDPGGNHVTVCVRQVRIVDGINARLSELARQLHR